MFGMIAVTKVTKETIQPGGVGGGGLLYIYLSSEITTIHAMQVE